MARLRLSETERKHQIQEAAKGIILEKGYENTTMDDVIEKSGMSTGGVYHYYKNVYEIFYDIMSKGLDYAEERSFPDSDNSIQTFVEYQMAKIYDDNEYKSLFSILLQGIARNEELRKMYMELNLKYTGNLHGGFDKVEVPGYVLDDKFLVLFIHSLMLGYESFAPLGAKEAFRDNKVFIKEVIIAYLERIKES